MPSLKHYVSLVRHLGAGWVLYRIGYAVRRRLGFVRRASPMIAWEKIPGPTLQFAEAAAQVPGETADACVAEAEAVLAGRFRLFSHTWVNAGFPPDWHANQMAGSEGRKLENRHWSRVGDVSGGDIKGVWELNRFPWAFALARGHARTRDTRYADAFWTLFSDWCDKNPPNIGANWMCGQEATFRLIAVAFAARAMGVPESRRVALAHFVVATGRRIAANLDYALSQKNNHGVSECVGLATAALLLPAHDESDEWWRKGSRELENQLAELVYADGGFSQHSLIYHRVLLHDLCWVRSSIAAAGRKCPEWLDTAGRRATDFLAQITDAKTGEAPLYGSNDGANILPLAEGDFADMRPAVQLASAVFKRELRFAAGPWDEAAAWLVPGWNSLPRRDRFRLGRFHAAEAGLVQLVRDDSRLVMRCPTRFRHRPAQADMLNVDVWLRHRAVALDGGSFSYNSQERFVALGTAREHNGLTVEGVEPMEKASRFLYLPWPRGTACDSGGESFEASHDGYARLGVAWTRTVAPRADGSFVIRDRVRGALGKTLRWHWRLADLPWELNAAESQVAVNDAGRNYVVKWSGAQVKSTLLLRCDETSASGWRSVYYGTVEPMCSLVIEVVADDAVDFVTELSAED